MRNAILIARNVLRESLNKKSSFIVYLVLPVLCVILSLFLYSKSGTGSAIVGIEDNDRTTLSMDMVKSMSNNDKFKIRNIDEKDVKSDIVNQKIDCVLVIPMGFENDIKSGNMQKLQLVSIKGESVTSWIKAYTNNYIDNLLDISSASGGNAKTFDKMYSDLKNQQAAVITTETIKDKYLGEGTTQESMGLFIMFILVGSATTANFILKEKEKRTYYRTFCAPVSSSIYILGNFIANIAIICVQVIAVILFMKYGLNIDTNMPDIQLFAILMDFGLVSVSFGLLIVAFSKTRYQANSLSTLIITPSSMIAGCFWPQQFMPDFMQKISKFFPQEWVLDAIDKAQNGASASQVAFNLFIIFAFAVVFSLVSIYKLRISDDVSNFA